MGTAIGAITLLAGWWAKETDRPWQSVVFLVLGVSQLGVALGSRARPGTLANPFLLLTVCAALGLQCAAIYLPPPRSLLGTTALTMPELLVASAMSALGYLLMRVQSRLWPEKRAGRGRAGPPGCGDLGPTDPTDSSADA